MRSTSFWFSAIWSRASIRSRDLSFSCSSIPGSDVAASSYSSALRSASLFATSSSFSSP